MQQGCLGASSGLPSARLSPRTNYSARSCHRVIVAHPPAALASSSFRTEAQQSSCSPLGQLPWLRKSEHKRVAVAARGAARAPAVSTAPPQGPAQFVLLTECGSAPSAADVQEVLPALTPKQLADAVWCFAQHEVKPSPELMHAVAAEIRSKLGQFRAADLSNTLWAFAMLKYQPSEPWWQDFERQVYGSLTDLTDRQLANLMWAFAVLERRPGAEEAEAAAAGAAGAEETCVASSSAPACPSASLRRGWVLQPLLSHAASGSFSGYSSGSLHLLVWSLGRLHLSPPPAWLALFLPAAEASFFRFSPTELSNVLWALAKLGTPLPPAWLDKLLLVAQWRFPSFPARLLSIVAWSAATLRHTPAAEWLMCFEEQVRAKFGDFSGHELACVAWSLRRFGAPTTNNAVFYMLQKQAGFLEADFEILANPRLLRQVLGSRAAAAAAPGQISEGSGGGGGGGGGFGSSGSYSE